MQSNFSHSHSIWLRIMGMVSTSIVTSNWMSFWTIPKLRPRFFNWALSTRKENFTRIPRKFMFTLQDIPEIKAKALELSSTSQKRNPQQRNIPKDPVFANLFASSLSICHPHGYPTSSKQRIMCLLNHQKEAESGRQ